MSQAGQYSTEEFLSDKTLKQVDEAVAEVFGVMLGIEASPSAAAADEEDPGNDRTGLVGLSGAMRGSCEVRMDTGAASSIASAMLGGMPIEPGEESSINDAVGEICNMLAAGWKNRVDTLSSKCFLSPPTVISGRNYKVHMANAAARVARAYQFEAHTLHITLYCVDQAAA